MMSSYLGLFSTLPGIILIAVQWVGVMAMRGERTGAWRTMIAGTVIGTIRPLLSLCSLVMMLVGRSSSFGLRIPRYLDLGSYGFWMFAVGGQLAFIAGFALHGLNRRAAREREKQLEAITVAMAEELRVLRERAS